MKVEIDTDPVIGYHYEQKFLSQPISVAIKCVDEECLFACKVYAAFFRVWQGRVKGRDWYDIVWFIRKNTLLSLSFFSKLCGQKKSMSRTAFLAMARERIDKLDIPAAIEDIVHFVRDQEAIRQTWSKEFFFIG